MTIKEVKEDETTVTPAPSADLGGIVDTLSDNMPDVQQHAIDQSLDESAELEATTTAVVTDKRGATFDANKHKSKKDGSPTLTKLGNFILKPAPKTSGVGSASESKSRVGAPPEPDTKTNPLQCRAAGAMAANLLITLGMVAGGEEWKPRLEADHGLDEKAYLESAFGDYFEATGKTDLPPAMALTVAIGAYALPRFTMPKTQTRIGTFKRWIVKKIAERKLKKHGLKVENAEKADKEG